jgi:hypothetical protein
MFNVFGVMAILLLAVVAVARAHGADMGMEQRMIESAGMAKVLSVILKYPLAVAAVAGAMLGSAVVAAYQEKNRLKQWALHTGISAALTPLAIKIMDESPTWDIFLGYSVIIAVASYLAISVWADKRIKEAFIRGAVHQIHSRLGDDEKPRPNDPQAPN